MTLIDTSAWVEFLRATESTTHQRVRTLIETDSPTATTDVIVMEVLAGARDDAHVVALRRLLARCEFIPTVGLGDFEQAAALYRNCRRAGRTIRALNDCLIAAVAIRSTIPVLHRDQDFDFLAEYSSLETTSG